MANRMKEDEKNEKIIRGLLKLPANRKCINCNNLGPQYVCTNFWTFICTNCSGIHREFTHRVKSISMAKFTTQEVIALQEGGNERAKETYFKEFDSQRHSVPDSSNIDRLRDFIKHVYVHRRYSGEKNAERPPITKQGDREDSSDNKSVDSYRGGSRSPPFNDRYSERAGYGGRSEMRSPGYDGFDYKKSPGRFEVVDEKRRDDRFGTGDNNRRFEERTFPVPKPEGRSPNHQKEISALSPPMVRPVRDILGDDAPTLRVGEPPKSNGTTIPDNVGQTQRSSSFSGTGSSDGTSVQLKRANSGSLIDFNADPEPPVSVPQQTTSAPAGGNWASFDITGQQKSPQAVENATTLESALAQLSAPGTALGGSMSTLPISGIDSFPKIDNGGPNMQQQQPSLFPSSNNQFTNPQFNVPAVGVVNQTWGSSLTPNLHTSLSAPAGYPSQVASRPPQEMSAGVLSQPPAEAKPSSRKALPEDLFAALYPMAPTSAPSWQGRPYHGMGYGMQYPAGMLQMMPTYPLQSQSSNPFDMINEQASVQAPMFPSMSPLQGALPNMGGPSGILRTSSLGNPPPRWIPPQQPAYPPALSQSPYMLQQVPSHMAQQVPNSMTPMGYSQPGTPNSFGGGNPFG